MRVSIEISGGKEAAAAMRRIADHAIDAKPAADEILRDMRRMVSSQFSSDGSAEGTPWAPLKPATRKAKSKSHDPRIRANSDKVLEATGAMRRSLTDARRKAGASTATKDEVVLASALKRAGIHHRGAPRRGIPARPLINPRRRDIQRWERILLRHITSHL